MIEQTMEQCPRRLGEFAPGTLRMLLAAVRDEPAGRGLWPADEAIDGLLAHVLRDRGVAALVEAAVATTLGVEAERLAHARPYDLAIAWPERLAAGDGRGSAVLLLAAARRPESVFRKLEARFVEDLEQAAAAAWMRSRVYESPCLAAMRPRKPAGTDSWRRGSSRGRARSSAAISHGGSGTSSSS
jgi:hypothetical protein